MKKHYQIYLLLAVAFLFSCGMSQISMQVLVPANVTLPAHINNLVIANRSLPSREDMYYNIIEGFLSGESIRADREGSENCLNGTNSFLNNNPRFKARYVDAGFRGTGTSSFAPPLNWMDVKNTCRSYGGDALAVLEVFDSNVGVRTNSRQVNKVVNNRNVTEWVYNSELFIDVNTGWRIYDTVNMSIIDEIRFKDSKRWTSSGPTERESLHNLPSKRNCINQSGYYAGQQFGMRISPNWVSVARTYYVTKHNDLKAAKNYVRASNWTEARKLWEPLSLNPDPNIAGRASYNMALASEMDGNLDMALVWAKKANGLLDKSAPRYYIATLERRIDDQRRLADQMNGK